MEITTMRDHLNPLCIPSIKAIDRLRGHRFNPPFEVRSQIPPLYGTEDVSLDSKVIYVHYSTTSGCDWYVAELDQENALAFGWAEIIPGFGEWGYFDLEELGRMEPTPGALCGVERDCHWEPKTWKEVGR